MSVFVGAKTKKYVLGTLLVTKDSTFFDKDLDFFDKDLDFFDKDLDFFSFAVPLLINYSV